MIKSPTFSLILDTALSTALLFWGLAVVVMGFPAADGFPGPAAAALPTSPGSTDVDVGRKMTVGLGRTGLVAVVGGTGLVAAEPTGFGGPGLAAVRPTGVGGTGLFMVGGEGVGPLGIFVVGLMMKVGSGFGLAVLEGPEFTG